MIETISGAKGVILDMRSSQIVPFSDIISLFLPKPTKARKIINANRINPGTFTISFEYEGDDRGFYYESKIVIVVNEKTRMGGEYISMTLQQNPNTFVIGSATSGTVGFQANIPLPGGILTLFPVTGFYYPDGRQVQLIGIAIDEEVKPTLQGIIEGRDELIEKAIKIIENE